MSAKRRQITVALDGTNRSLQQLYRAYNIAYYGGQLDRSIRVKFSRKPVRAYYGEWVPEDEEITINSEFRCWPKIVCWILLHEIAHLVTGSAHGKKFHEERLRQAQIGAFAKLW